MDTSQRVHFITAIARALLPEGWQVIDLTLSEFGLPTYDDWNGNIESYVFDILRQAPDSDVERLAAHLGLGDLPVGQDNVVPDCWPEGHLRLFLSHVHTQQSLASTVQSVLGRHGVSVFVAHADIKPTREWMDEIEAALASADALAALLSDDFHASSWTDQEVGYALGRGLPLFPVSMGPDPYGFIGRYQAIRCAGQKGLAVSRRLLGALSENHRTAEGMRRSLGEAFKRAGSFAIAKELMGAIASLPELDAGLVADMRTAVAANHQVTYAFGVPEGVERLAAGFESRSRDA